MNLEKFDSNPLTDKLHCLKSPAKKETCLDLFNVFHNKFSQFSSNVNSVIDSTSTRSEEETSKSVFSIESGIKLKCTEEEELDKIDKEMTLCDIISKKKKDKTVKENKKRCSPLKNESAKKKRKSSRDNSTPTKLNQISQIKEEFHDKEETKPVNLMPKIILVDGKPVLDNSAMEKHQKMKKEEVVIAKAKLTTSNSFKNYNHTDKWTEQETRKFYRALEIFGTDFSLIAQLFPHRNRIQIKNKFLKEEKVAGDKIDLIFSRKDNKAVLKLFGKIQKFNTQVFKKCEMNQDVPLASTTEFFSTPANNNPMIMKLKEEHDNINNNSLPVLPAMQQIQTPQNTSNNKSLISSNSNDLASITNRKPRSESFASVTSVNSLDMEIINDLSDLFKR